MIGWFRQMCLIVRASEGWVDSFQELGVISNDLSHQNLSSPYRRDCSFSLDLRDWFETTYFCDGKVAIEFQRYHFSVKTYLLFRLDYQTTVSLSFEVVLPASMMSCCATIHSSDAKVVVGRFNLDPLVYVSSLKDQTVKLNSFIHPNWMMSFVSIKTSEAMVAISCWLDYFLKASPLFRLHDQPVRSSFMSRLIIGDRPDWITC